MTHRDFTIWLEGFLAGKNSIDSDELVILRKELERVIDEPRVERIPPSYPIPREPNFVPGHRITCDTAKSLMKG